MHAQDYALTDAERNAIHAVARAMTEAASTLPADSTWRATFLLGRSHLLREVGDKGLAAVRL